MAVLCIAMGRSQNRIQYGDIRVFVTSRLTTLTLFTIFGRRKSCNIFPQIRYLFIQQMIKGYIHSIYISYSCAQTNPVDFNQISKIGEPK